MDLNYLNNSLPVANSARRVAAIAEENCQSAKRNEILIAGAEANIEQKNLLEQQLEIIHEQNRLLQDNYDKLKEMYDAQVQANKDAADELEKNKRFNILTIVFSVIATLVAITSLIVDILDKLTP